MKQIPKGIVPHLTVKGADKAIEFYRKAFGAQELYRHPHTDGRIMHATVMIGDSTLFVADFFPEYCQGQGKKDGAERGMMDAVLHQYVPDVDAAIKRAADAGATVTMPAEDMFWGDRYGQVKDPFGQTWAFATPVKQT